jgi:predicted phosphodiesterase
MKTLVISDTHFYTKVDSVLLDYILDLLSRADKVILNGDFWDGFLCSFDEFYHSGWNKLFKKLKEKKAVYIHGNHDEAMFMDDRVHDFSVEQQYRFEYEQAGKKYLFEHGHQIAPEFDSRHPHITTHFKRFYPFFYHNVMYGNSDFSHFVFNRFVLSSEKKRDSIITNYISSLDNCVYDQYVCGHSHIFHKKPVGNYLNSGVVRMNTASYLLIDGSDILPITEKYR